MSIIVESVPPRRSSTVNLIGYGAMFGNVTPLTTGPKAEPGEPLLRTQLCESSSPSGSVEVEVKVISVDRLVVQEGSAVNEATGVRFVPSAVAVAVSVALAVAVSVAVAVASEAPWASVRSSSPRG